MRDMQLLLSLAQQIMTLTIPPHMLVLTYGAQVARTPTAAAHGGALGFARVQRIEHPVLRTMSFDVVCGPRAHIGVQKLAVAAEASGVSAQQEVALGADQSPRGPRLRQGAGTYTLYAVQLHSRGTLFISGGLGGLGLRASSLLIAGGASCLVLTSRSGQVARDGQQLEAQLQALGFTAAAVRTYPSDVSDAYDCAPRPLAQRLHLGVRAAGATDIARQAA